MVDEREENIMRDDFAGMLPGAIDKFEALLSRLDGLNPKVIAGYQIHGDENDLRTWGVVCNIKCDDMKKLADEAEDLDIVIQDNGSLAYTNGLTIDDFKTNRVQADLTLAEREVI
jgi:hypothetical protein